MKAATTVSNRILLAGPPDTLDGLVRLLRRQPWSIRRVHSTREVLHQLRQDPLSDIVVLAPGDDLESCIELCRNIKLDNRTRRAVVTCILPPAHTNRIVDVFAAGADDCIRPEACPREICLRLEKALRLKHASDSLEEASAVVTALAAAVEAKDHYTYGHVDRVAAYCLEIGRRVGVEADGMAALRIGGVVHDIGKVGIPDHVLNKPGKLTDEEMAVMRRHPVIGYEILRPLRTLQNVLPIVRGHHERPNGTGYPDGLAGEQIPLLARIAAVADVFDAISTDRPYRPALPLAVCQHILHDSADKGDLDPQLVAVFLAILQDNMPVLAPATLAAAT